MDTIIADLKKIVSKLERYKAEQEKMEISSPDNGELLSPGIDGYATRSPRHKPRTNENTTGTRLTYGGKRKRSKARTRKNRK